MLLRTFYYATFNVALLSPPEGVTLELKRIVYRILDEEKGIEDVLRVVIKIAIGYEGKEQELMHTQIGRHSQAVPCVVRRPLINRLFIYLFLYLDEYILLVL